MNSQLALKKQLNLQHQINTSSIVNESMNISKFPLLFPTPEKAKIEPCHSVLRPVPSRPHQIEHSPVATLSPHMSTISIITDSQHACNVYHNQVYESPLCSTAVSILADYSSCSLCCSQYHTQEEEDVKYHEESFDNQVSEQFHSVNGSFFDQNQCDAGEMYICCRAYEAKNAVSEISLEFSERVKLVYVKGDVCLVQSEASNKRGYVPSQCLSKQSDAWISEQSLLL